MCSTSSLHSSAKTRLGIIAAVALLAGLAGCATAPRGPAAALADAGVAAANSFATEYRETAANIRGLDASEAFTATYQACSSLPQLECQPRIPSDRNYRARQDLAKAILLRGRAIESLKGAYSALRNEADYDAKADLTGAINEAIDGANDYAGAIFAAGGAAPAANLITAPLSKLASFGAGLVADRSQQRRLRRGSHEISLATRRVRDALSVEAYVYNDIAGYIERGRLAAKKAALQSGIASGEGAIAPLIASLGLKPAAGSEAMIRKSPATLGAIEATLAAQSRAEIIATRQRYEVALAALDELLEGHADFESERAMSLADLNRFLGELNVALTPVEATGHSK
jgi:hypothetical protein